MYEKLREFVHPDFVLIGMRSSGPFMMHRDDWLDAIERRDVAGIDLEIQDATATDTMMVGTVFAKWRLKYLGREIEDCVVLTDVWVKDDGSLASHSPSFDAVAHRAAARAAKV